MPESGHFHAVRFYEDAASLAKMVAGFVAEGLITGQPGILDRHARASACHQPAVIGHGIQPGPAEEPAQPARCSTRARPSPPSWWTACRNAERFEEVMIPVIDAACRNRTDCVIRAYGEMVDVLWKDGKEAAAIRLEMLWNQLANVRAGSRCCAAIRWAASTKTRPFDDICHQHTHMVSAGGDTAAVRLAPRVSPIH